MLRKPLLSAVALALVAAGCSQGPSGPQRYTIDVDAPSSQEEKFQFSAYFPGQIRVAAGDSISFRNRSTEAPHTITFGVKSDRTNQPPIIIPKGENPVVTGACDIDDEPSDQLVKCPGKELGAYDGTGYWNSGYLLPDPAPDDAGPNAVTVRLADDIEPGSYNYVCILHPLMSGAIEIVDGDGERSTPAEVRESADEAAADARGKAEEFEEPKLSEDGDTTTVTAGWGDRVTAVNRFAPAEVEVEEGSTVRWELGSPYEPHTVTFNSTFDSPDEPGALVPGGPDPGGEYSGGFANSGIIGKVGFPFDSYSLEFTKSGSYEYVCILHPGQTGVVKVK